MGGETVTREQRFYAAMAALRREVADWNELLDDPFKAPELKVGLPPMVTAAAWEVGLAWHVLTEKPTTTEAN